MAAVMDVDTPSAMNSGASKKRFEVKKWNEVALWAWDIVVDNCAICSNHMMDLCECTVAWGVFSEILTLGARLWTITWASASFMLSLYTPGLYNIFKFLLFSKFLALSNWWLIIARQPFSGLAIDFQADLNQDCNLATQEYSVSSW
uniref:Ring-box 1, E3 ubiquitin protein ligase n=1 Tax=Salmo trutta TaxID=8032 RepID=A0A674B9B9_SALTR